MADLIESKNVIIGLSVNDDHFEFATNISTALKNAETEYQELNDRIDESIETIKRQRKRI
ncbi:hypothetical protein SAMN05216249_11935 [Acetitomaculum ruminis DSM 5522]|uniref:Uncharacterized protein n=1 Tax=Acetitomaculum ruminis DSM 5522 TaxID=1120918 RepID=A0A1I0ZZQ2_9FIRM|nr:hypothetical protein [Acetitomaculum ruminis]SFB31194.1 hypothetical protein SAMN05216249_11935 [Acetitomaculum ruminis DSM 5522]